jgi:hypothetical protein
MAAKMGKVIWTLEVKYDDKVDKTMIIGLDVSR